MASAVAHSPPRRDSSILNRVAAKGNLFGHLRHSSFGIFNNAMNNIRPYLTPEIKQELPQVVVVGSRDAGKSSLLENITKCAIFPRDRGQCTRMPIKFQLQQVLDKRECSCRIVFRGEETPLESPEEILEKVMEIMATIGTFSEEELTISLKQVNIPTFDFIDLPGLQTHPEEDRLQSEGLVNKYIKNPNTLVLCVIPATDSTLDSGTAIKVLTESGKLPSTILALTKSDKVLEEDIKHYILNRVLLTSETGPDLLPGLQGCVAVMNRKPQDSSLISLEQAAVMEQELFNKMLAQAPEPYQAASVMKQLQSSTSSQQLMVMMDKMYHNHIVSTWKNHLLAEIIFAQMHIKKEEDSLGPDPTHLKSADVIDQLYSKVSFQSICSEVAKAVSSWMPLPRPAMPAYISNPIPDAAALLSWAEDSVRVEALVQQKVVAALNSGKYFSIALSNFRAACTTSKDLKHLGTFHEIVEHKLSDRITAALLEAKPVVDDLVKEAMQQLLFTAQLDNIFHNLEVRISRCIVKHVINHIKVQRLTMPSDFIFTENADNAQKRAELLAKHAQLDEAAAVVNNIDKEFHKKDDAEAEVTSAELTENNAEEKVASAQLNPDQVRQTDDAPSDDDSLLDASLPISHAASAAKAKLYEEHQSASPSFRNVAQLQSDLESIPLSSSASDLGYINVP